MKLKYEFALREIADQFVAVPMGEGTAALNGFVKMNDVGAAIFECLKEDADVEKIADALTAKFDGTREEAVACVTEFTDKLKAAGLVE